MKSINELLRLFMRQAALESSMRQAGEARLIEEQKPQAVRQRAEDAHAAASRRS